MVFGRRSDGRILPPGERRGLRPFHVAFLLVWLLAALAVLYAMVFGHPDGGLPRVVLPLDPLDPAASAPAGAGPRLSGAWTPTVNAGEKKRVGVAKTENTARAGESLTPAPVPDVVMNGRYGPLPVIAPDGRRPLDVYARPFDHADKRPRIALVVGGLGLSRSMTETAISTLPPAVTLSFIPYEKDLQLLVDQARQAGHEVLLELPMEPFDYPHNDPGPYTLLAQADVDENLDKLDWLLSRFSGYAGVINYHGDKFMGSPDDLRPVLSSIHDRGLYFLDRGTAKRSMVGRLAHELGLVWAISASVIDQREAKAGIDLRLLQLEEVAREKGSAVGTGFAFPVTLDRIKDWAGTLEAKGLVLAPVSALVSAPQRQASVEPR